MKKITPSILLCLTLFYASNTSGKGNGWIQVFNGTYEGNGFTIPYCSSLLMISYSEIGIPGDSTDWYLNGEMISRTYSADTFHATKTGLYTARMYFSFNSIVYTIGPLWDCDYGGTECSQMYLTIVSPCPSPSSGFSTTNISSIKATLNWNTLSCGIGYKIRYRVDGTTTWSSKSVNGNTGLKKLTQLNPNTTYEWGVRTKCASQPNIFSSFSATQTFTTASIRQGIEQPKSKNELIIYPNPASENIFIEQLKYDASGKDIETVLNDDVEKGNHILQPNIKSFFCRNLFFENDF